VERLRKATLRCALVLLATGFASAGSTASAATFTRGFVDSVWFDAPADGVSHQSWLTRTKAAGARLAQIEVDWTGAEPDPPAAGASLTNPSAPQFNFGYLDREVEEVRQAGLQPVFLVTDAPRWAQHPGGTASEYANGAYEPNATAFGDLAEALARRYSGRYPAPQYPGHKLPRVRYLQAWGEANMSNHLSPQWTRVNGRVVNTGANIYRQLLNAFYAGVKAGDRSDVVLTSGLEAYGDAPFQGYERTHPVTFLENLLCLDSKLERTACAGGPAHFDVLASDPYDAFAPTVRAVSRLDASAPDLGRLRQVITAAGAAHTLLPDKQKPLWVTEFGYDSSPPNPAGLPLIKQARWLEQSFYVFWREGVSSVMWYLVRDQTPPYDTNYFSGVYFRDGRAKPSLTAYRFPFVLAQERGHAQIWGIAPASGTVSVQRRNGSGWSTITTLHASAGRVFVRAAQLAHGTYRATVDHQHSLAWVYQRSRTHGAGGRPRPGAQPPRGAQPPSITFSN
jgi:hypothetical protein